MCGLNEGHQQDMLRFHALICLGNRYHANRQAQESLHIFRQCERFLERYASGSLTYYVHVGLAQALLENPSSSRDELREAERRLVDIILPNAPRYGIPEEALAGLLEQCRERLATRDHT